MRLKGPVQKMVAQKVLDNLEQKLVEAEKKLEGKSIGELSGAKANLHIQIGEITDMQVQMHKKFEYPELRIQTAKKKYVFHCRKSSMDEVEQFMKELRK
jgi:hypothetical protein